MRKAYLSLALVFFVSLVAAESVPNSLNLNLQVTDSSGNPTTGTYTFIFNLTNQPDCTSAFYTNSTTLTTDARGIISYTLTNVNSSFDQKTYLCYYRDGVLKSNISVAQVPNAFKAKNVSAGGIVPDANLNISSKNITADWFDGKLNYSNIRNPPTFLTQTVGDLLYCKLTGCTMTGNLVAQNVNVSGNLTLSDRICNATACYTLSDLNNSASETDPTVNRTFNQTLTDSLYVNSGGDAMTGTLNFDTSGTENQAIYILDDSGSSNKKIFGGYGQGIWLWYLTAHGEGFLASTLNITTEVVQTSLILADDDIGPYFTFGANTASGGGYANLQSNYEFAFLIENRSGFDIFQVNGATKKVTMNNATFSNHKSCDLKTDYLGNLLCGIDAPFTNTSTEIGVVSGYPRNLNLSDGNITVSCISIMDNDGGGWSHIQMLDGAIVNGTGAC